MIYLCTECNVIQDKAIQHHKLTCNQSKEVLKFENLQKLHDYYLEKIWRAERELGGEQTMRRQSERVLSEMIQEIAKTAKKKKRHAKEFLERVGYKDERRTQDNG